MGNIFSFPSFEDNELHRKSRLFHTFIIGLMAIVTLSEILDCIILPQNIMRWISLMLIFNVFSILCIILNKNGKNTLASYLFISFVTILVFVFAYTAGGMESQIIKSLPIIILSAGLLLSWRQGVVYAIIAIILGFIMVQMHQFGVIPISPVKHTPYSLWTSLCYQICFLGFLQYITVATLDKALKNAESELELRKQRDNELQKSQAFQKRIFDNSQIAIAVLDFETMKFVECNEAAISIFQFASKEDALTKTPVDVSPPLQADGTPSNSKATYYCNLAIEKGIVEFEWKHERPNGEIWDAKVQLMGFISDEKTFLQFTVFDISNQKIAENTIIANKANLHAIIDNTLDKIWAVNTSYEIITTNSIFEYAFYESFNVYLKPGMNILEFLPKPFDEVWKKHYDKALMNERHLFVDEFSIKGSMVYVEVSMNPIIIENKVVGVSVFSRDITERKQAEIMLKDKNEELTQANKDLLVAKIKSQKNEERLHFISEYSEDVIWTMNLQTGLTFSYLSESIYKLLGYTVSEAIDLTLVGLITPESMQKVQQLLSELITQYDPSKSSVKFIVELDHIHKNGSIISTEISTTVIFDDNGAPLEAIGVTRNIAERKKAQLELETYKNHLEALVKERTEELAATNEEIVATNEELVAQKTELENALTTLNNAQKNLIQSEKMASLGVLSAGIAHEINNPLNFIYGGILGIEEIINESKCDKEKDEIMPLIDAINIGVSRASEIVTSLSHYSRSENLPNQECNIHEIINNCLIMLQNQLKNKVAITKKYADPDILFFGNESKLHQAFLNILANAEQAIENSGTIIIETTKTTNAITISIQDSGMGISQENIQRICDPFFTTKAPGKGTGLGLSITYKIINEHNGRLEFISKLQKGTTAVITLPIF